MPNSILDCSPGGGGDDCGCHTPAGRAIRAGLGGRPVLPRDLRVATGYIELAWIDGDPDDRAHHTFGRE